MMTVTELDTTDPIEINDWASPPDMTGHPSAVDDEGNWLIETGRKVVVEKWTQHLSTDGSSSFLSSATYEFHGMRPGTEDTLLLHDKSLTRTIRIPLAEALSHGWRFWFPTKRRARRAKPKTSSAGDVKAAAPGRKGRTVYESKRRGVHCLFAGVPWSAPPETAAAAKMKVIPVGDGVFELPDGSKETWVEVD